VTAAPGGGMFILIGTLAGDRVHAVVQSEPVPVVDGYRLYPDRHSTRGVCRGSRICARHQRSRRRRRFLKVTVAAISLALAPILVPQGQAAAPAAEGRTLIVSANRLASESTEGKAANQRLQQLAQRMAADISAREKDGKTTPDELLKLRQQSQVDYQNAQRQAQTEIRTKLNPLITEIAQERKADMVLNADTAVVWWATKFDITNEVIAKMNAQAPK
jgi:Skp family chaperone for outer membrane proteins